MAEVATEMVDMEEEDPVRLTGAQVLAVVTAEEAMAEPPEARMAVDPATEVAEEILTEEAVVREEDIRAEEARMEEVAVDLTEGAEASVVAV